jgi:hypothetical protein
MSEEFIGNYVRATRVSGVGRLSRFAGSDEFTHSWGSKRGCLRA